MYEEDGNSVEAKTGQVDSRLLVPYTAAAAAAAAEALSVFAPAEWPAPCFFFYIMVE